MIWENLHIYVFLFSVVVIVGTFAYIKLTYPFWSCQPVYHVYDIWRYFLKTPHIISHQLRSTKFCDFEKVLTQDYLDSDPSVAVDLLQCYYLSDDVTTYILYKSILDALMTGHLRSSYVSTYMETRYKTEQGDDLFHENIIQIQRPVGVVFSRICQMNIGGTQLETYYVDQYAVNRDKTKKAGPAAHHHVGRVLLQTHLYSVRQKESEIQTALLKTSEPYSGVVPIFTYTSSLYNYIKIKAVPKLPAHFVLSAIRPENLQDGCLDFLPSFDFDCRTGIANMAAQLKENILFIYTLRRKDRCYAIYFFRDSRVHYEMEEEKGSVILELTNSAKMCQSSELYLRGLIRALTDIQQIKKGVFGYLSIDHISHNDVAIEYMSPGFVQQNHNYLYLYNYFMPTFSGSESSAFILL